LLCHWANGGKSCCNFYNNINLAVLGGNDPHSSGVTSQRASMNTLRPKLGGPRGNRTPNCALQGHCVPNYTISPNSCGVRDRTRTCIIRICNPLPSHSAHTHINHIGIHYQSPGFEPVSLVVFPVVYGRASSVLEYNTILKHTTKRHLNGYPELYKSSNVFQYGFLFPSVGPNIQCLFRAIHTILKSRPPGYLTVCISI